MYHGSNASDRGHFGIECQSTRVTALSLHRSHKPHSAHATWCGGGVAALGLAVAQTAFVQCSGVRHVNCDHSETPCMAMSWRGYGRSPSKLVLRWGLDSRS